MFHRRLPIIDGSPGRANRRRAREGRLCGGKAGMTAVPDSRNRTHISLDYLSQILYNRTNGL